MTESLRATLALAELRRVLGLPAGAPDAEVLEEAVRGLEGLALDRAFLEASRERVAESMVLNARRGG